MKKKFYKMHGIGNDYLFFNCFGEELKDPEKVAIKLSERRFSVGGDGIILVERSSVADAKMRIFNADGSEGKMCGNGLRCLAKFLYEIIKLKKSEYSVETLSGIRKVYLTLDRGKIFSITADMGFPRFAPEEIPMLVTGERVIDYPLCLDGEKFLVTCLSMGNPHCVIFCEDVDQIDVARLGEKLEHHDLFPEGVNVEFVEVLSKNELKMRVFERGSGETFACGTGACAAAVAGIAKNLCGENTQISVHLRGGTLSVKKDAQTVYLTGLAELSYTGVVELD